jgi:hypothetical protein
MRLIPLENPRKSISFHSIKQRFLTGIKLSIFSFCLLLISTLAGCQRASVQTPATQQILPPDVAGTWKAQDSPWKIVLSTDGTVSSAVIPMGEVEVKPNQTTKAEMKDGSISTFTAGDCIVEYTPRNRELYICIEMEKIDIKFLDNVIAGNSTDRFVGTISQDGKLWKADWINVFDYGPQFPQDPNDIYAKPLIFEKIN